MSALVLLVAAKHLKVIVPLLRYAQYGQAAAYGQSGYPATGYQPGYQAFSYQAAYPGTGYAPTGYAPTGYAPTGYNAPAAMSASAPNPFPYTAQPSYYGQSAAPQPVAPVQGAWSSSAGYGRWTR